MAFLELDIAAAALFRRYKVELVDPNHQLDTLEWFNASPGELEVRLTPRVPAV